MDVPLDSTRPSLAVGVLGPLCVTIDGAAVPIPGVKRRAVLALLALAEGRTVPVADLVDALWADEPPDQARAAIQSHVSRLRRHLGPLAHRLEAADGGYGLRLVGLELDLHRAQALLGEAHALGPSDPAAAARLLEEAMVLWRGNPLAELSAILPIAARIVTLIELRRQVEALLVECMVAAGEASRAVGTAAGLAAEDPLGEDAARLLVLALAEAGRTAEALRAANEYRRRLREETGLVPSARLAELERRVASGAPAVSPAANRGGAATAAPRFAPGVPVPRTTLVGRDAEVAALARLLQRERVATVVGPGGVGKTRLAVEVARRHDDVTFLGLAPLGEGEAIPAALAAALGLEGVRGDALAASATFLSAGPHLLVVDNCEHVLAAAAAVVDQLLAACPELTVLATSREALNLPGECQLRLAPLPLPDRRSTDAAQSPSVAVFLDRARRARPGFAPDAGGLALIGDIVRRLDGLPLSIELAASRLSSFALADLHGRLDRSLDLLGGRWDTAGGRRETLRSTLQWSYDLLPAGEQRLFRHLAVFPDGFDLDVAEHIAAAIAAATEPAAPVGHLVAASMLEVEWGPPARYRMLETLRSFGLERLDAEGERDLAEERMLQWAAELARWAAGVANSDEEHLLDERLGVDRANLRAAWRLSRRRGAVDVSVALVVSLSEPSTWRELPEVWQWADELVADPVIEPHPRAAAIAAAASECAWMRGDLGRAGELAALALSRASDDEDRSRALAAQATVDLARADFAAAFEHGLAASARPSPSCHARLVAALAAAYSGDAGLALQVAGEAIPRSPTQRAEHAYVVAECASIAGRPGEAAGHYQRAIEIARPVGSSFIVGIASVGLVTTYAASGRQDDALRGYRDLLAYWERAGNWLQMWTTLRNLARLLRGLDDDDRATFLEAAADRAPDAPGVGQATWGTQPIPAASPTSRRRGSEGSDQTAADGALAGRVAAIHVARQAIDEALARSPS